MSSKLSRTVHDNEDYTHPERFYRDLVLMTEKGHPEGHKSLKSMFQTEREDLQNELCWSCGWRVYDEVFSGYQSRLRIAYTRANHGIWGVGSRWMISDRPNDATIGNDFITQEFLRNQPNLKIPLLKEMRRLSEPTDKVAITLMSRAKGEELARCWRTLTMEQKTDYAKQVVDIMKELRKFTSPVPAKVDGTKTNDIVFTCPEGRIAGCHQVGSTTEEWLGSMKEELFYGLSYIHRTRDSEILEEKYQELIRNFPNPEPYVLTHGDLSVANIMVKDGKIEAVIDWEMCGYHPWWVERWRYDKGRYSEESLELLDLVWKDLDSETNRGDFYFGKDYWSKVNPVYLAWNRNSSNIDHNNEGKSWYRPGFCKCQPYFGRFRRSETEDERTHIIKKKLPTWY